MNQLLVEMRGAIDARVREQIERHLRINPTGSIGRIVEMQMEQERERLERLIDESDQSAAQAEALVALLGWLPQLELELKRRAR
jgi:transposase